MSPEPAELWSSSQAYHGSYVREDPYGQNAGQYINPNEDTPYKWRPCIKNNKGALIAVGSLRGLLLAAIGDFDEIVQFDYDLGVSAFNRINIELLKLARDRHEYLVYWSAA